MGSLVRALVSTLFRAPATTATLTTLYLVLRDLPVGGQPTGSWTHVTILTASPDPRPGVGPQ